MIILNCLIASPINLPDLIIIKAPAVQTLVSIQEELQLEYYQKFHILT